MEHSAHLVSVPLTALEYETVARIAQTLGLDVAEMIRRHLGFRELSPAEQTVMLRQS